MPRRDEFVLPLRIDSDPFIVTHAARVLDANREVVAEFESIDDAERFVANANGADEVAGDPWASIARRRGQRRQRTR